MTDEEKRSRGRPPAPPGKKLTGRNMRFDGETWAKIDAAGIKALRAYLKRWRPKPEPPK